MYSRFLFLARVIFLILFLCVTNTGEAYALYDPDAPLRVRRVELSTDRPKGFGVFSLKDGSMFKKGEPVYIYIELDNCKPVKEGRFYNIDLIMDVDIYFENGICVYSRKGANSVTRESLTKKTYAYLWTKVETPYLKPGEYKVEMTIRDENSGKETFYPIKFSITEGE